MRKYNRNIKTDENIKRILDGDRKAQARRRSRRYYDVDPKAFYPTKEWPSRYAQAMRIERNIKRRKNA